MAGKLKSGSLALFLLLLLLLRTTSAMAEVSRPLEFGVFNMPPFYILEDGKPVGGICIDIMETLLRRAALPYRMRVYPTARLYANLASGKTDLFIGIKEVSTYKDQVLFSNSPVAEAELGIYYKRGSAPLQTRDDFIGKRIIVVRGYSYAGLINFLNDSKNNIRLEITDSHKDALKMLELKRADYFLDYTITVENYLKDMPGLHIENTIFNTFPLYLIVSRKTPGAEEIMERLMKVWADGKPSKK
jgi:ABC-type amino acid transport substrate-binding protein